MGIAKNDVEKGIFLADNIVEMNIQHEQEGSLVSFTDDNNSNNISEKAKKSPQSARKKKNYKKPNHCIQRVQRSGLPGLRSKRRKENLEFLLAQIDGLDIDINESQSVDLCDLIEFKPSVFTELFQEEEKMSAWNDFINSSEDEQLELLKNTAVPLVSRKDKNNFYEMEDGFIAIEEITPGKAFARINYRLRHFLSRKQIPKGELEKIEVDLIEFFLEWPNSVYVTCLPDGFRRMLLHAVSQYLDLEAKSFDSFQGSRKTQVEAKGLFMPPETTLVNYLEMVKSS